MRRSDRTYLSSRPSIPCIVNHSLDSAPASSPSPAPRSRLVVAPVAARPLRPAVAPRLARALPLAPLRGAAAIREIDQRLGILSRVRRRRLPRRRAARARGPSNVRHARARRRSNAPRASAARAPPSRASSRLRARRSTREIFIRRRVRRRASRVARGARARVSRVAVARRFEKPSVGVMASSARLRRVSHAS